jgi:hypothetical protein
MYVYQDLEKMRGLLRWFLHSCFRLNVKVLVMVDLLLLNPHLSKNLSFLTPDDGNRADFWKIMFKHDDEHVQNNSHSYICFCA